VIYDDLNPGRHILHLTPKGRHTDTKKKKKKRSKEGLFGFRSIYKSFINQTSNFCRFCRQRVLPQRIPRYPGSRRVQRRWKRCKRSRRRSERSRTSYGGTKLRKRWSGKVRKVEKEQEAHTWSSQRNSRRHRGRHRGPLIRSPGNSSRACKEKENN